MANEQQRASEALSVAIQLEKDGMAFYEQASLKTASTFGKRMFLSLVEDERRHIEWLNEACAGTTPLPDGEAGAVFRGKITTIFREATEDLHKRLDSDPDDVEAVKIAMDFEQRGYKFYEQAAADATDEGEAALFRLLAVEENGHWTILEDTYTYLTDPAQWDIRANPPLLDGGA